MSPGERGAVTGSSGKGVKRMTDEGTRMRMASDGEEMVMKNSDLDRNRFLALIGLLDIRKCSR